MTKYYDEKAKLRTQRYRKAKRDRITVEMSKEDKQRYKSYAESKGKSMNSLIIELLEREMKENP